NDELENPSRDALSRSRLCWIEILRPHNSFGSEFVEPGEQHCDWKSDRERNDNKTHRIIRNLKKWKDLRGKLREEPCDDSVSDRCAVNIAPLQLRQNVLRIHSAHLDEALVTAAILGYPRDLKSMQSVQIRATRLEPSQSCAGGTSSCGFRSTS